MRSSASALLVLAWVTSAAAQPQPRAPALPLTLSPPAAPLAPVESPPVESVSLDEAVRRALTRNPNVTIALEEIRRAQALVEETRALSLPTLSANVTYTRLDSQRVFNGSVLLPADLLNGNLLLAVPLVQPGGWVRWSHAHENVDVTHGSAAETQRQLAIVVARTYLSILVQKRVLDVTSNSLVAAVAHYDFAHQRFAGGYGTRVDEVRALQEVATDRAQVENAKTQLTRLREALGVFMAVDHGVDAVNETLSVKPPPTGEQAMAEAESRVDVKLQKRRLAAAQHVQRDDWADYVPTLYGTFSPFLQTPPTSTIPEQGWQAQLLFTWPIYDGGLRYGLAKERKSLSREAAAQLEATLRQAGSDVRVADEEVRRSTVALAAAVEAAQHAKDALDLTSLGYRAGASTNFEVIDAERQSRDAGTAAALAEDAFRQALLDLLIASGRFPGDLR